MAVVASATGVALGMTAGTIGAGLVGGAVLGAGAGALYSAVTKDGNILNSALTGALIGGGVGGLGAAAGPALMGEAAAGTVAGGAQTAASASPALQAAQGLTSSNIAGLNQAAAAQGVFAEGSAALPGAGLAVAPETIAPATSSLANVKPVTDAGMSGKEMLGYGLAGTAALSLLGGMNQPKLSTSTGTTPSYIRPYTYSQTKNPNYGQPGQSYYTQSYTAQPAYQAKEGGVIRMAQGGLPAIQTNMYPQSQQVHTNFSTPTQMPTSAEIVASDFDAPVNPYTGEMTRMADGGVAIDPNAQAAYVPAQVNPAMQVGIVPTPAIPSTYAPAPGSAQATVDNMYRNVLGRRPEAAGQQFWMDRVNEGVPTDDIRKAFSSSPENRQNEALRGQVNAYNNLLAERANQEYNVHPVPTNMLPGGGSGASAGDMSKMINQSYLKMFGRQGDPEGLAHWSKHMYDTGANLSDIEKTMSAAPEGQIASLYKNVLGRRPDQPGMEFWRKQLDAGTSLADIQKAFQGSTEAKGLPAPTTAPVTAANFNAKDYLASNPDVAANPYFAANPYVHYQQYGQNEGRPATALANATSTTGPSQADIDAYLAANPTNVRTYNAATQTYGAPNVTQAQINAWKASTAGTATVPQGMYTARDGSLWASQEAYDNAHRDQGGGANGGMMPNALRYANGGGIAGAYNLGSYSDGGRLLKGPGDGVSDDIPAVIGDKQPARLAEGEFVIPARIVSELGNGSTDAGAKRLYSMMDKIQAGRKKTIGKDNVAKDTKAKKHLLA